MMFASSILTRKFTSVIDSSMMLPLALPDRSVKAEKAVKKKLLN